MKISHLFDDPIVRALLEEAERDQGDQVGANIGSPTLLPSAGAELELEPA